MDKMIYTNLGYAYDATYMKDWNTGRKMYVRVTVYYKNNIIYTEDLFGPDMYYTTQIFNKQCRIHQRDRKLEELGI